MHKVGKICSWGGLLACVVCLALQLGLRDSLAAEGYRVATVSVGGVALVGVMLGRRNGNVKRSVFRSR